MRRFMPFPYESRYCLGKIIFSFSFISTHFHTLGDNRSTQAERGIITHSITAAASCSTRRRRCGPICIVRWAAIGSSSSCSSARRCRRRGAPPAASGSIRSSGRPPPSRTALQVEQVEAAVERATQRGVVEPRVSSLTLSAGESGRCGTGERTIALMTSHSRQSSSR